MYEIFCVRNIWELRYYITCTILSQKRAHCSISAHPWFCLNFQLRSKVHSKDHPPCRMTLSGKLDYKHTTFVRICVNKNDTHTHTHTYTQTQKHTQKLFNLEWSRLWLRHRAILSYNYGTAPRWESSSLLSEVLQWLFKGRRGMFKA